MSFRQFIATVLSVILGVVLTVFIYASTIGDGVTHTDLDSRLANLERAMVYNGCVIAAGDNAQLVAECQVPSE